jgi:hypothetical protein
MRNKDRLDVGDIVATWKKCIILTRSQSRHWVVTLKANTNQNFTQYRTNALWSINTGFTKSAPVTKKDRLNVGDNNSDLYQKNNESGNSQHQLSDRAAIE